VLRHDEKIRTSLRELIKRVPLTSNETGNKNASAEDCFSILLADLKKAD
jgi:hypothetical protein